MKRTASLLAFFIALVTTAARADTVFSGDFFAWYPYSLKDADAVALDPTMLAWLNLRTDLDSQSFAKLTLQVRAADRGDEPAATLGFREAYVDYALSNRARLKFGKQIVNWGNADILNPTNYFAARDYDLGQYDLPRSYRAAHLLMLNLSQGGSDLRVQHQIAIAPFFARDRYFDTIELGPGQTYVDADSGSLDIDDAEAGYRLVLNGAGWDASLSAFRGRLHAPEFFLADAATLTVRREYRKVSAIGGDLSLTAGDFILRGESAAKFVEQSPSFVESIFGVERRVGERFRVMAQLYWKQLLDDVPPALAADQAFNATIQLYDKKSRLGHTLRIAFEQPEGSGFEAEAFYLMLFNATNGFGGARLSYRWSDTFRTTLGANAYFGEATSAFGYLEDLNHVYLEARLWF